MIGILMLETTFHRPIGDIGNPKTFSFPVIYKTVKGATVARAMDKAGDSELVDLFVKAAKVLENEGAKAITTSCGFLAIFQQEIQRALTIPFFSSSLLQIPFASCVTGGTVGVMTAKKSSLTARHFKGVGADHAPVVIEGMDDQPAFTSAIVDQTENLNENAVAKEMEQVTYRLLEKHPEVTAIVLECTNMPPYRKKIQAITDFPIFDINALINYMFDAILGGAVNSRCHDLSM
ncbi:aspartate/glutamate racemase family protein [Salicibibacter cibarius]|uniref:Aspartate/glutamate racemase family protein n=1 Tax=Salicibibacter cibarius TaxID=2743000 RepID=A0A7T7CBC3_9BACI|nr:aspartate/glutamate racemase family protein [Salicibibacter cibarius]QQK75723.1 aspartate/glutamate racemase family protein [Salicibibacter cibarius]